MLLRNYAALLFSAVFFCVFGTLAVRAQAPAPANPPTSLPPVTVGRTTVAWSPANGLNIAVDGVPVVRKSTLHIVKKGYTGEVLYQTKAKPVISAWQAAANGAQSATVTLENENAVGKYTFTVSPNDAVDVDFSYRLKQDIPAEIEYGAGHLNGMVLQGAMMSGPENSGVPLIQVPVAPPAPGRSQEENRLAPPLDEIRFATRLGFLTIAYSGTAPKPVLFDARSDAQEWAKEFPVFWLGIGSPQQPVVFAEGERNARFRFLIGPRPGITTVDIAEMKGVISRLPVQKDAYTPPQTTPPLIIPRPKQMTVARVNPFRLTPRTKIVLTTGGPDAERAGRVLQRAVAERYGFTPDLVPFARSSNAREGTQTITIGLQPNITTNKPEGYGVDSDGLRVRILGKDGAGMLWGAQTVVQLLSADTAGPLIPALTIRDWPTLAMRGVHLFHGQKALPFHQKLIDRVFSRFKINTLVIQAEQVRWDSDPEVAPSWAGTKADLKAEIVYARERGIRMYPLVQSYGHMEWLFNKPKNREFAEDPDLPYAVNFTNPDAVAYLEKFNAEADDLFGAPAFHIGLDEVTMRGRFPYRSKPRPFADLFVTAATHWRDFFKKRGKETWMWADMALFHDDVRPSFGTAPTAADAAKIRGGLPKDIVMVDWQYGGHDRFPSIQRLKDAGFQKIIAATWFRPDNIQNLSRAAAKAGILGALQTTWAGYESKEDVLTTDNRKQFTAMVLAAEYFWNGGEGPAPNDLPYDAETVFARQMAGPDPAEMRPRAGFPLHLGEVTNQPIVSGFGYGGVNAPDKLSSGPLRALDGTAFQVDTSALVLSGKLNPGTGGFPGICEIPIPVEVSAPAKEARVLLTAMQRATPGLKVGTIEVKYAGGETATVPLVYGQNIASWEDSRAASAAPIVWKGKTRSGQPFFLRRVAITAPQGKTIESLRFVSANAETAPGIFGITVLAE
jgi:hexosaminidase